MTPNYDEIEQIKQGLCEGCNGLYVIHETGCYKNCKPFQDELREIREDEAYFWGPIIDETMMRVRDKGNSRENVA